MPKRGLKFYIEHNSCILTMSSQAFIFKLSHSLKFMMENGFHYKNDLSTNFLVYMCWHQVELVILLGGTLPYKFGNHVQ